MSCRFLPCPGRGEILACFEGVTGVHRLSSDAACPKDDVEPKRGTGTATGEVPDANEKGIGFVGGVPNDTNGECGVDAQPPSDIKGESGFGLLLEARFGENGSACG